MKERGKRIYRLIKHIMLIAVLVLAVLLSIRGMEGVNRGADREKLMSLMEGGAKLALDRIWRMNYTAAAEENEMGRIVGTKASNKRSPEEDGIGSILCSVIFGQSPVYRFLEKEEKEETDYQEADPAFSGYLSSRRFYNEHQYLKYDGDEGSGAKTMDPAQNTVLASANAKKNDALTCASSAIWPIVGTTYRKEQLADYDFLMKHFYTVQTATTAGRDLMKAEDFLAEDFTLQGGNDKPQILIYHTHSQEAFADFGPDHKDATVVGIGTYLTKLLADKGYHVIHDTTVYDLRDGKLDRNKAYTYSLEGVTDILQKNPSIEVLMDIHRDGVDENLHMVNDVNGKPTAPVMFFNGVSQTPEGPNEYLPNPYRKDNLAFSFQMQLDAAAYFPGLTRKIYIKGLRYNLHLRPRSMLVEVGAQTNTYQEALNAMEPLAEVLNMVLQGN